MRDIILCIATVMIIFGYLLHSFNYYLLGSINLSVAMILLACAMYFLF